MPTCLLGPSRIIALDLAMHFGRQCLDPLIQLLGEPGQLGVLLEQGHELWGPLPGEREPPEGEVQQGQGVDVKVSENGHVQVGSNHDDDRLRNLEIGCPGEADEPLGFHADAVTAKDRGEVGGRGMEADASSRWRLAPGTGWRLPMHYLPSVRNRSRAKSSPCGSGKATPWRTIPWMTAVHTTRPSIANGPRRVCKRNPMALPGTISRGSSAISPPAPMFRTVPATSCPGKRSP